MNGEAGPLANRWSGGEPLWPAGHQWHHGANNEEGVLWNRVTFGQVPANIE